MMDAKAVEARLRKTRRMREDDELAAVTVEIAGMTGSGERLGVYRAGALVALVQQTSRGAITLVVPNALVTYKRKDGG